MPGRAVSCKVGTLIADLPKLTGILPSYTCIGWKYPVSKSFLPETKFSLSLFPNKVNDISAVCYIIVMQ